ncbi:MAG: hypothetical protein EP343_19650 [Deltaproteobacteria bacterium]|nr:MAG: hypothetical protein EP343_19650 [Deltaproteobacteria bacterium]
MSRVLLVFSFAFLLVVGMGCAPSQPNYACRPCPCASGYLCHNEVCVRDTSRLSDCPQFQDDSGPVEQAVESVTEEKPEPSPDKIPLPQLTAIEGDGLPSPVVYENQEKPAGAQESRTRFQKSWILRGKHLDRLTGLKLLFVQDKTKQFDQLSGLELQEGTDSMRIVKLPKSLFAGMFLIVGLVGTQDVALGQVFVLQGEKGDKGDKGDKGAGFEAQAVAFLQALQSMLKLNSAQKTATFTGVNVQIVNGMGGTETTNGYGNLVVGYNKGPTGSSLRKGSHNVVVGDEHSYQSYGGLVSGYRNTISGKWANVSGGSRSVASGEFSSVCGGQENKAANKYASVTGGFLNEATGENASVSGGFLNIASETSSSVLGGNNNQASGQDSTVSGGSYNKATHPFSSVSGGLRNLAKGTCSSVSGGSNNEAIGESASVCGGSTNKAQKKNSSVSGGSTNVADGESSTVSGGQNNTVSTANGHSP